MPFTRQSPRRRYIRHAGLSLSALDWSGAEPALVILPGITSPAATWSFVAQALAIPNRILIPDIRGRGESQAPDSGYSLDDYADDLAAWLHALGLARPVLLGHSMGARIVANFDARHPGVARSLIVVDPPLSGPGRPPYPTPLSFYLDGMAAASRAIDLAELRRQSPGWPDERLLDRQRWLPTCAAQAVRASHMGFHEEDFFSSWARVSAGGLFIRGENSPVVSVSGLEELRGLRPDFEYESVPGAGHMIPWDNLEGFAALVGRHIHHINQEGKHERQRHNQ